MCVVVQIIIHIVALFKLVFCCFSNCFKLHLPLVYICEHISLLSLAHKRGSHRSLYQEEINNTRGGVGQMPDSSQAGHQGLHAGKAASILTESLTVCIISPYSLVTIPVLSWCVWYAMVNSICSHHIFFCEENW